MNFIIQGIFVAPNIKLVEIPKSPKHETEIFCFMVYKFIIFPAG